MRNNAYSAPEAEILAMEQERPFLTLSNPDVTVNVSRGDDDGYGEVSGGYDGNWE